jgi:hypothetical protein
MLALVKTKENEGVTASLEFCKEKEARPITLVNSIGEGFDSRSDHYTQREVFIQNARPLIDSLTLDQDGFALIQKHTAVGNFYDDSEVENVYYPEIEQLLQKVTGASKVLIFDHTRRIDDKESLSKKNARPPATIVHNDFTISSAKQRVRDLLPTDEAESRLKKRFASINVWRAMREPVETAPLAICNYSSIADDDLIIAERHYADNRVGRIYNLAFNPMQRWYYFPKLMCTEMVLLKCYDSLTDGTARWTAHGSFKDPEEVTNSTPRESIEIRSMLFFE